MEYLRKVIRTNKEPDEKEVLWVDTAHPDYPVMKYYENGNWKLIRQREDGVAYIMPYGGIPYSDLSQEVKMAIASGGAQANWNQTNSASPDFIWNKPYIPTALADLTEDSNHKFVSATEKTSWSNKADRVQSAVAGHIATLDSSGNLIDSGKGISDINPLWGNIQGSIENQTDLMSALGNKYEKPSTGIPANDIADGVIPDISGKADKATSQAYGFGTTFPANPKEGDIFVILAHEDQLTLTLPEGETPIQLDVPYGKLRWEVDEACQLARIAAIKWLNVLTNRDEYEYIPGGHVGEQPLYYDDTIERGRDFSFRWVDGECVSYEDFVANFQYISLYSIVPDVAYEYKNGVWEERKDMSDVLRYSYQDLDDWEKSQARENISAFKDIVDISDTITSNLSLARYITMLVAERGPGIYTFRFTGKLSDGDTDTATYRVLLVGASEADCIVSINSATLISRIDSKLYRILLNNGLYYLEPLYIKPASGIPASDIASGVIPDVSGKADAATTLAGYGITDAYTKTEVDSKVSSAYKAAGTVASVASLGTLDAAHEGFVYNMSASFTTTSDFVEGSGTTYPAGTNVAIVNTGTTSSPVYKYDVLAGFVDISGKADKSEMSVVDGTDANADKTTITLKSGTSATVLKSHQDITGKADKVSSATNGHFAGLDSNGNLTDSGKSASDFQPTIDSSHKLSADLVQDGTTNKVVTESDKTAWNAKQDAIVFNTAYNASTNKAATMSDVPTVPTISTDIDSDGTSDTKTASPKAVKTFVEGKGYTTNTGTVTGIKVGTTDYSPSSGVVSLPAYPSVPVTDVTVGGTSVVSNGTAAVPAIPDAVEANPTVPSGTTPTSLSRMKIGSTYYEISGGSSVTISTDVATDKDDNTKATGAKAVYDFVKPQSQSSIPAGGLQPGILYNLSVLTGSVTINLATPSDANVANEYAFTFATGGTLPTITWPASLIGWAGNCLDSNGQPELKVSKFYEVSILNNIAIIAEIEI